MFYTWKFNFVLFLSNFCVNMCTAIDKVVSMLFSQRWSYTDEHTLTHLSLLTRYQRANNIGSSGLNQHNSFNAISTLFCQRWNNVDKHASAQLLFSTWFQRWHNIGALTLNRRNFTDVASTLLSHSQKSATVPVTSVTSVLTIQHHIKICNKYLKNWLEY